jgi:hypothetical protein
MELSYNIVTSKIYAKIFFENLCFECFCCISLLQVGFIENLERTLVHFYIKEKENLEKKVFGLGKGEGHLKRLFLGVCIYILAYFYWTYMIEAKNSHENLFWRWLFLRSKCRLWSSVDVRKHKF